MCYLTQNCLQLQRNSLQLLGRKNMEHYNTHSCTSRTGDYILDYLDRLDCNTWDFGQSILVSNNCCIKNWKTFISERQVWKQRSNTQKHLCAVSHSGAVMTSHVKIFLHYKFDLVMQKHVPCNKGHGNGWGTQWLLHLDLHRQSHTLEIVGKAWRNNGHKLKNSKFHVNIRKRFFTEKGIILWNKVPREVIESPFLELFRSRLDRFLSILL